MRGSAGKYARAEGSSYYQYNTYQQNLASFIAQFYPYGYHTPDHDDLSRHVGQLRSLAGEARQRHAAFVQDHAVLSQHQQPAAVPGDQSGAGNAGRPQRRHARSYGVEFSLQYGDFSRDGLSGLFSYTHTENQIRFSPINGVSVIDALNAQIELYNSYTSACAGVTKSSRNWQACGSGAYPGNALPVLRNYQSGTRGSGQAARFPIRTITTRCNRSSIPTAGTRRTT